MEQFRLQELTTVEEMETSFSCIIEMYPDFTRQLYRERLQEMILNNYSQLAVYEGDTMVAISGIWLNTKLWCGKYMELDNVIVKASHRSAGIGKIITNHLNKKAAELNVKLMALDAYVHNKRAHKFYMNDGYDITGFHFTKKL